MISQNISGKLISFLEKAMVLDEADMGIIHLFDSKTNTLELVSQKGFQEDFLEYFKTIKVFENTSYGRAALTKSTIIISDVTQNISFTPHRSIAASAGFCAVKSIPLLGNNKELLGIISTHFKEPKWVWEIDTLSDLVKEISKFLQSKE